MASPAMRRHDARMTDEASKRPADVEPEPAEASADGPKSNEPSPKTPSEAPAEELRKALDHLGRAAASFRDRYVNDEKVHEVTEKARVGAEHLTADAEKAVRKAGGVLDELAVDAEQSLTKVAHEAEKALREAQKTAAPALRRGLARLSEIIEGKSDSTASSPEERDDDERPRDDAESKDERRD